MLATFGLGRLEEGLIDDTVSPADVVAFLEQAKADCAKPAIRAREKSTYPLVDDEYVNGYSGRRVADSAAGLPVQVFGHRGINPEFQPTRHAFPV